MRTASYKLRERGAHAPEKELGADGIFQIEVLDLNGKFIVRKGLLFQSKIGWTGRDGRLFEQARNLLGQSESAIVIDYSPDGYKAIPARMSLSRRETANGYGLRMTNRSLRFWEMNLLAADGATEVLTGNRKPNAWWCMTRRHRIYCRNNSF